MPDANLSHRCDFQADTSTRLYTHVLEFCWKPVGPCVPWDTFSVLCTAAERTGVVLDSLAILDTRSAIVCDNLETSITYRTNVCL